jgi:hypothetical protein
MYISEKQEGQVNIAAFCKKKVKKKQKKTRNNF